MKQRQNVTVSFNTEEQMMFEELKEIYLKKHDLGIIEVSNSLYVKIMLKDLLNMHKKMNT